MILESREVTKKYGSKTAVNQVSLQLEPGLVYAMLGPNGSGKTTWMKMVAGLVKPTNGEILYQGTPIGKESKKEIAYMSTEPYLLPPFRIFCHEGSHPASGKADVFHLQFFIYAADRIGINGIFYRQIPHRWKLRTRRQLTYYNIPLYRICCLEINWQR